MPTFEYKATDPMGETVQGTLAGSSLVTAASELEKRGLRVEHLAAVEGAAEPIAAPPIVESPRIRESGPPRDITSERNYVQTHVVGQIVSLVSLSDLLFFFRQLATMLKAGVGMVQTLETLSRQTGNPKLKSIVAELTEHAREGRPMSFGMQRYPEVFSPLILAMIRVGEESGTLDAILGHLAEYIDREIKLRNLIRRQTLYPKIVLASSIGIILVANAIITSFGGTGLISSPLTSPVTWIVLAPLIVGMFLFVRLGLPNPRIKTNWDQFILGIPYLGTTVKMMAMAKFGRALAAMYRGGVPLHKAAPLAADACGSEFLRGRIYPAARRLEDGTGVTQAFAETGVIDPIVLDMIQTGEHTGNLDLMLDKMADFYEDDAEVRANAMAMILGVCCLILVGAYVLYIAITFYAGRFAGIGAAAGE